MALRFRPSRSGWYHQEEKKLITNHLFHNQFYKGRALPGSAFFHAVLLPTTTPEQATVANFYNNNSCYTYYLYLSFYRYSCSYRYSKVAVTGIDQYTTHKLQQPPSHVLAIYSYILILQRQIFKDRLLRSFQVC